MQGRKIMGVVSVLALAGVEDWFHKAKCGITVFSPLQSTELFHKPCFLLCMTKFFLMNHSSFQPSYKHAQKKCCFLAPDSFCCTKSLRTAFTKNSEI